MTDFDNWIDELISSTSLFLDKIRKESSEYKFFPTTGQVTKYGKKLNLGFSCYALKINYIIDNLKSLDSIEREDWIDYINSFQVLDSKFPKGSFIDPSYIDYFNKKNIKNNYKWQMKDLLSNLNIYKGETSKQYLSKSIIAETKQAMSSILQVGGNYEYEYLNPNFSKSQISDYLLSLNWNNPWDSGAQFANTAFFISTSNDDTQNQRLYLSDYISSLASNVDGTYGIGKYRNSNELINGSMKVLTGLDWLNKEIHYPDRLIDSSLKIDPSREGCDLVDVVYVLYKCLLLTDYRKKEVLTYLKLILKNIQKHYFENGGFSYYKESCQTHYYGVKIAKKTNSPDLHGTILLIWAISMVDNLLKSGESKLKILKP